MCSGQYKKIRASPASGDRDTLMGFETEVPRRLFCEETISLTDTGEHRDEVSER